MTTYFELARSLSVPGPEQTRAFARHVTDDHSWYKHQSLRGFDFIFFLDPAARAPGHWNYVWFKTPQVRAADGRTLEVPPELIQAGTVRVNRLMYGRERASIRERELDVEDEARFSCIFAAIPRPGASVHVFARVMGIGDDLPALPGPLADALRPLLALWRGEPYRRELAQVGRELSEVYRQILSRPGYWDDKMKELGGERIEKEARAAWERTEWRAREKLLLRAVIMALDAERERQVGAMVKAMVGFLAALGTEP